MLDRFTNVNNGFFNQGLGLPDLIFGSSLYFPPVFKALFFGFILWLLIHRLLRDWLYSGDVWHPTLMDLSLFILCVCGALLALTRW